MSNVDSGLQLEKLLRRERGERLFSASGSGLKRCLVLQVASKNPGARDRLADIGERLARVGDSHGPQLLDWSIKESGLLQLVTTDPAGVFLADLLEQQRLSLPVAVSFWEGLLRALAPLHDVGLVYGLCHPGRLLVDRRSQVLLPEAGLVPALSDRLAQGMPAAGSLFQRLFVWPDLVPPELLRQEPLSPASDVYLSAALFYRLVTGNSPYGEGLSVEIYNRMLKGQIESLQEALPDAPRLLTRLIDQCLSSDPVDRPENAQRLRHQLGELALVREPLAESLLKQVERPYSSRYPGILSVHSGTGGPAEAWSAEQDLVVNDVEKEVLLGQLDRLRAHRSSPDGKSRWTLWVLLAGLALLGVLALPYLLELGRPSPRQHEGRLPEDSDGRTHREVTWVKGEDSPHPTIRSLFASVSVPLRRRLEAENILVTGELEFVPPVLPPYRVLARGESQEMVFEFTARNRLRSIRLLNPGPDGAGELVVLYDAEGAARTIAVYGPDKQFLRYLGISPQKNAESPTE
jgi:serine/threonine protein kinase